MANIFISYRRGDTGWVARNLCDRLIQHFGAGAIFMDVDTIEPGDDFVAVLEKAVSKCDALLAMIGRSWVDIQDERGQRRLDDPNDFVHLEIAAALDRRIRVIPVLVDGTSMPREDQLPASLASLSRRQAFEIRHQSARQDTEHLVRLLERQLAASAEPKRDAAAGDTATKARGSEKTRDETAAETGPRPWGDRAPKPARETARPSPSRTGSAPAGQITGISQKIVGIDLGTTNSAVAVMEGDEVKVVADAQGLRLTPSIVTVCEDGKVLVGSAAAHQASSEPRRTICSVKRFMGRRADEVDRERTLVPYGIAGRQKEYVQVAVTAERQFQAARPATVSAYVLQHLRDAAEAHLGQLVQRAVLAVPACFSSAQREATKNAAEIAGLDPVCIINEPTAAALAYCLERQRTEKIAVLNLGGGAYDVSLFELNQTENRSVCRVLSTRGDSHLGGDDFTAVLLDRLAEDFRKETGHDVRADASAVARLRRAVEQAKHELSEKSEAGIVVEAVVDGERDLKARVGREEFERVAEPLLRGIRRLMEQALGDARLSAGQIDQVLLVGGSSRMPAVQSLARDVFKREPYEGFDPEEAVAVGAAIQGSILACGRPDIRMYEVLSHSLGLGTHGGKFTRLVARNARIPVRETRVLSTAKANQRKVGIHVLEGEHAKACQNRTLGHFYIRGIPPAPKGVPKIEVAFHVDRDGILSVKARDLGTGTTCESRVEAGVRPADEEIARSREQVAKAGRLSLAERQRLECRALRTQAEEACTHASQLLEQHGEQCADDERRLLQDAIRQVRSAIESEKPSGIRDAIKRLADAVRAVFSAVYGR